MALVPGICTQCGATLSADNTKDCMICPYCGTPFIVEKAINNFHNTYNISNSVVNIYSPKESDFVIRAGVLEKYTGSDTVVSIPDNVIAIGNEAFRNCTGLEDVSIPESVESIGSGAFQDCRKLKKVVFPKNLKEIGLSAFSNCYSLSEIYLPDSVTKIGGNAFYCCTKLVTVRMPNNGYGPQETGGYAYLNHVFPGCNNLTDVDLPNESWLHVLNGSKYYLDRWERLREQENKKQLETINKRKQQGVCTNCGGKFKGIFDVRCSKCGKSKDY